jgi:hypothetical protein
MLIIGNIWNIIPDIGAVAEDGYKGKGNNTGDDGNGYDDGGSRRGQTRLLSYRKENK